jgi:hypothetical protein
MHALLSASRHPVAIHAAVERARRQLLRRIARTVAMPDARLAREFEGVVVAVEAVFRQGESAADLLAPASLHGRLGDHALILAALHRSAPAVADGDVVLGRAVLHALHDVLDAQRLRATVSAMAVRGHRPASWPPLPRWSGQ